MPNQMMIDKSQAYHTSDMCKKAQKNIKDVWVYFCHKAVGHTGKHYDAIQNWYFVQSEDYQHVDWSEGLYV